MACQDFISATDYFFSEFVKSKLERANFISILNNRTTDAATIEQEILYVTFLDPDTYEPCIAFLEVAELESKNAQGLKNAIYDSFFFFFLIFRKSPMENIFSCI